MRRAVGVVLATVGSAALVLAPLSAVSASSPSNAPNALVGTADCGANGTFDFVVNSGNAQGTTWNPAFVTRSDGQRGLFLPASFDLTFTSPFGTDTQVAAKPGAPGPVTCQISANPAPGFSLSGTVTGRIVWTV